MAKKRKGLSKRVRFEVFKRDGFKCQYCGRPSPDVILVVDHIHPVSEGGTFELINLITSCNDCNGGKSNVLLADSSAVSKQRRQMEALAERREQLEMLVQWRDGLASIEDDKARILIEKVNARLHGATLNEHGESQVKGWLVKFGMEAALYGIAQAYETDSDKLIAQMGQFSAAAAKVAREPELREFWAIRSLMRKRGFNYGAEWAPINDMRRAFRQGLTIEEIRDAALCSNTYSQFLNLIFGVE